jgi:hypothetical protein
VAQEIEILLLPQGLIDSLFGLACFVEGCSCGWHCPPASHRIRLGNFGDSKSVGSGVEELRIDFGPRYRIYYGRQGSAVVLLRGGDKRMQRETS